MPLRFRAILCPTDFSQHSEAALRLATHLAAESGARLTLIHVQAGARGTLEDPWVTDHLAQLRSAAERRGVTVEVVERGGRAADEILKEAQRRGCDLLVLGTRGRTGLNRAVTGSIAEAVVRRSPCPVLVVRAEHGDVVAGLGAAEIEPGLLRT